MDSDIITTNLHEMGWNDTLAVLRRTQETHEQKLAWCQNAANARLPNDTHAYQRGVRAAADAYMAGEAMIFKGPPDVIAYMEDVSNRERS